MQKIKLLNVVIALISFQIFTYEQTINHVTFFFDCKFPLTQVAMECDNLTNTIWRMSKTFDDILQLFTVFFFLSNVNIE